MSKKDQAMIDRIAEGARQGRISRRDFMNYSTAAGLGAAGATSLWASAASAAPQRGGTFRWGIHDGNTSDSHDPGTYLTRTMIFLAHTHRSFLTMINGDGSLGPDLADSWEGTADASQWTFTLTPNAHFGLSGNKVTAKDVVASLNHHRGEDSTSAAKALLADVEEITADGDHTVVVKLTGGNADFPWLMTDYHLAICPANDDGTIDWESGDGSGPYVITSGDFGVQFSLTRNENWHGEGAWFDKVEIITLNDPNARQTALVTGDVDAVSQVDVKTMALMQRDPNIQVFNIPSAGAITLPMLTDVAPFDNVDVRNALKLSINREEMIAKIMYGAATIGNDFHHSPAQPYWPDDIPQRAYDPDQAKALLKKAGAEGLTVNLSAAESVTAGAIDMAVLYAEQAKAAGITINVVREPNDGYYSDVWLKKPWCLVSWGARPTPDVMYTLAYKSDAAWNESHWQN
ncbi:MAG TPA: ABC transporter substrate-binding protein, partial [Rhodobacterales bacterium]|nr:ABC transporter substrate-binding protein [Rhodobacterales bacterium]